MTEEAKTYEMLDIVTGEAAFRAYGRTLPELFQNAATALFSIMVDLSTVQGKEEKSFTLSDGEIERLFIDYLSELVYLKDAEAMLFSEFNVQITESIGYALKAQVRGERINGARHKLGVDVKGVTMHMYKFERVKDGFQAQVVLDI